MWVNLTQIQGEGDVEEVFDWYRGCLVINLESSWTSTMEHANWFVSYRMADSKYLVWIEFGLDAHRPCG